MSLAQGFVAPPCAKALGWTLLDADAASGTLRAHIEARPEFCNPAGTIQGGFLAAMLDETLGPTVRIKTGGTHYAATIDLNVSFLAPARPGRLLGVGRVVRMGKTIAFLEAELFDGEGQMIARATASARVFAAASKAT